MALETEINYLKSMMLRMANTVISNLKVAFDAYLHFDSDKKYIVNDDLVDQQERLIEEECLDILVKERPYASDLRIVTGILKLISDIERLGDHAEDILEFANKLKAEDKHHIEKIDNLSEIALTMVNNALLSFVKNDQKLAAETIENDKIVDKGYYDLVETLISLTENKKVSAAFACYSVLMVKYIERIADHAVNIAEWVIYILSGYHKDKRIF